MKLDTKKNKDISLVKEEKINFDKLNTKLKEEDSEELVTDRKSKPWEKYNTKLESDSE